MNVISWSEPATARNNERKELTKIELSNKRGEIIVFIRSWDNFLRKLFDIFDDNSVTLLRPSSNLRWTSRDHGKSLSKKDGLFFHVLSFRPSARWGSHVKL